MSIPYKKISIPLECLEQPVEVNVWIDDQYVPETYLSASNSISWREKCTFQGPRHVKISVLRGKIVVGKSSQKILTDDGKLKLDCDPTAESKQNQVINGQPFVKDSSYAHLTGDWHHTLSSGDTLEFDYIFSPTNTN